MCLVRINELIHTEEVLGVNSAAHRTLSGTGCFAYNNPACVDQNIQS